MHTDPETGQVYDMDACLEEAERWLKGWKQAQDKANELTTTQKHQTAAETSRRAAEGPIGKAKEDTIGSPKWAERQVEADRWDLEAHYRHRMIDIWMKRFEAARSEYSAGRRVE